MRRRLHDEWASVTDAVRTSGRGRLILAGAGALVTAYGALLMLEQLWRGNPRPVRFLTWWVGGPLLVDLVAVPLVIVAAIGLGRVVPDGLRRAVDGAALVSGLLVLVAVPLLSGVGRRPDNPSLLDRNYPLGLATLIAVVWLVALVPPTVRALRHRRRPDRRDRRDDAEPPEV